MKTKIVKVERAFYWKSKPTKVGDVLELPHTFALEMIAARKASAHSGVATPAPPAPPSAPAVDLGDGGKKGGGKHAG